MCSRIARAHRYHPKTGNIARPNVDVGRRGWDRRWASRRHLVRQQAGPSETRFVTAKVGTKLDLLLWRPPDDDGKDPGREVDAPAGR